MFLVDSESNVAKAINLPMEVSPNHYLILDDNLSTVGFVEMTGVESSLYILEIYIMPEFRRLGFSTSVVNYLLDRYPTIYGDCSPTKEAYEFWKNVNAEFYDDVDLDSDCCVSFIVYR